MKLILVYVEFPEVIESVVVVVQVLLQGARHCYDRPTQQNALLIFSCSGNLIPILYCLATWPAVSSPGRSVLNIHFFIESGQKKIQFKTKYKIFIRKIIYFSKSINSKKIFSFFQKGLIGQGQLFEPLSPVEMAGFDRREIYFYIFYILFYISI